MAGHSSTRLSLALFLLIAVLQGCGASQLASPGADGGLCRALTDLTSAHDLLIAATASAKAGRLDEASRAAERVKSIVASSFQTVTATDAGQLGLLRFLVDGVRVNADTAAMAFISFDPQVPLTGAEMLSASAPAIAAVESVLPRAQAEAARLEAAGVIRC